MPKTWYQHRCQVSLLVSVAIVLGLSLGSNANTVLNFVGHWKDADLAEFEAYAQEYTSLHPDIQIQHIYAPMWGIDGMNKLLVMSAGGAAPDIFHTYLAVAPEMLAGGMMAPMPPTLAAEVERFFLKQVLGGVSYKGKVTGIPTENQTYVLGYNERILQETGLAQPPQTWAELRWTAARTYKGTPDGNAQRVGLTIDGGTGYIPYVHTILSLIWSNNGDYVTDDGKVLLTEQPVVDTLDFLADMARSGFFALNRWIGNGTAAMSVIPPWRRGGYVKDVEWENMRTTLIPHGAGSHVSYQYGWGLFVASESKHSKEAWDFLRWYTLERGSNGYTRLSNFMSRMGSLPTNRLDISRPEYRKEPFFAGFVSSLDVARSEPVLPEMPLRQQQLFALTMNAALGQAPIRSSLEQARAKIEQILADSRKQQ